MNCKTCKALEDCTPQTGCIMKYSTEDLGNFKIFTSDNKYIADGYSMEVNGDNVYFSASLPTNKPLLFAAMKAKILMDRYK